MLQEFYLKPRFRTIKAQKSCIFAGILGFPPKLQENPVLLQYFR